MHKRYKICSWCSANHKGYLCLRWDAHKEPGLSQPQTSLNDHKDLVRFFTIKSPRMRGQYKFFEIHHNFCDSLTTPSPSSEQIPKSNEHTEIIGEVLSLKIWEDHSKGWLKSLLRSLDWSEVWRRECLNLRNVGSKGLQVSEVSSRVKDAWGSFYSPQKESFYWDVRDPGMSGLGTEHVCK
jgi:hypothetical protein